MTTDDIYNLMTELMKMLTIYPDEKTDYPPIHSPIYSPPYMNNGGGKETQMHRRKLGSYAHNFKTD